MYIYHVWYNLCLERAAGRTRERMPSPFLPCCLPCCRKADLGRPLSLVFFFFFFPRAMFHQVGPHRFVCYIYTPSQLS